MPRDEPSIGTVSAETAERWAFGGGPELSDLFDGADAPDDRERRDPSALKEIVYDRFSPAVCEQLGFYVYRLVDPRNNETFYVGRGVKNRVFDHMEEAESARLSGRKSPKTDRINAIHAAGQKVRTIVHRHALADEAETAALEAALIQAYPNLTNQVAGSGTRAFGARSTDAVIEAYDLPPAHLDDEKVLLISITKRWPALEADAPTSWSDVYARARHGWSLDVKRARKADFVVVHAKGIVRAVFTADAWLPSTDGVFAAFPRPRRTPAWGFVGAPAPWYAFDHWVDRRVPDKYRTRFGRRIRYHNV